jgi:outer membrane biosynthesis protein TonB
VVIRFTIGPTGTVGAAEVVRSDLTDRDVAPCIANGVRRWTFAKPPAGTTVSVTCPFLLMPG